MNDPHLRPALWMLAAAFAFASMGAFTSALSDRCDWLLIALVRALFMLFSTLLMARARGIRLHLFRPRTLWIRSLAGSVSLVCNFYAMTRLPIADVLTLTNTYPLWIVLFSTVLLGAAPSLAEISGVAAGVIGVALIQQPHVGANASANSTATAAALIASLSTSVALLGLHRLRDLDPRAIMAHFAGVSSVVVAIWLASRDPLTLIPQPTPITFALLLAVGAFGTIGQLLLTKAYAASTPARLSAIGLSQVAFALLFDLLIWSRIPSPLAFLGFLLVVAPTACLTASASHKLAELRSSGKGN